MVETNRVLDKKQTPRKIYINSERDHFSFSNESQKTINFRKPAIIPYIKLGTSLRKKQPPKAESS